MRKKIFLMLALLCAVVQGVRAQITFPIVYDDVWDGSSTSKPAYYASYEYNGKTYKDVVVISKASELAYLQKNWEEAKYKDEGYSEWVEYLDWLLMADLDMSRVNWIPMVQGYNNNQFCGTFYGNNHTICISITNIDNNYEGLFAYIHRWGTVQDLHVTGEIAVGNARLVGGIAGINQGNIRNCWVSADISSTHYNTITDATLGGIVGSSVNRERFHPEYGNVEYCCMTGNVSNSKNASVGGIIGANSFGKVDHVTFYGTRTNEHEQDNLWIGKNLDGTLTNQHSADDLNSDDAVDAYLATVDEQYALYRQAVKYPYAVNVKTSGYGNIEDSGTDARPGQTYKITIKSGRLEDNPITVKDAAGNDITGDVGLSGNRTDGFTFTMPRKNVTVEVKFDIYGWPTDGQAGTEDDPYTISNSEEWAKLASVTGSGHNDFSGKYILLKADLSVTQMIGWNSWQPFSGTFLGNGHTLTFSQSDHNPEHPEDVPWQGISPFHYIKNATIRDLKVKGIVYVVTPYTSGLVGFAEGTNLIENCIVSTTLDISDTKVAGDAKNYAAGIVGNGQDSNTTIRSCVFNGTINDNGSTKKANVGGIWGYSDGATPVLENCLEAGTYEGVTAMHPIGLQGNTGTITNCYYVNDQTGTPENACTVSGATQVRALTNAPGLLGSLVHDYGTLKAYAGGILFGGTYYVPFTLAGAGTEASPYIIGSESQWNDFANYVTNSYDFRGKYVKLTDNIAISEMAGADDSHSFQGIFDGDGHTLTFTKGTAESPFSDTYCAPFRHVKNAVIKNLHVDGTITISGRKAAGFVGESHGGLTITGCRSSININSSHKDDATHGGFVATLTGSGNTITIDGCVFDGSFATTNGTTNCGGFVGWGVYNKPTIKNSLMIPASVDAGMLVNTFARWYTGDEGIYEPTITNCYYIPTGNLPANQGMNPQVFNNAPATLGDLVKDYGTLTAYKNGILYGGTYYMAFVNLNLADNSDNSTTISDADGYFADVTLADRTLYKDGKWNTLCLPFNVTLASSPLAGAVARPLTEASISGTVLNLTFGTAVSTLVAGTPYIIKWAKADGYVDDNEHNIVAPVFSGVTIDKTTHDYDNAADDLRVRFLGTYKSTTFDATDNSILLMGADNTLYYPTTGADIGAQRAYFKIGSEGALLARQLTSFNMNFGDGDNTAGILEVKGVKEVREVREVKDDSWYSLDGRRLDGKPSRAGVYLIMV